MTPKRILLAVLAAIILGAIAWYFLQVPRTDHAWAPELARTASAEVVDGVVHLRNVRDWTYGNGTIETMDWKDDVAIDPADITRAWFMFEPFSALPVAGHTYITFELADGRAYSFSIEARKEVSETYEAWKGLFRQYELAYTWGTERDFLMRRLAYLGHPLHIHELAIDAGQARTLFEAFVAETNTLATHPRFYNTLTANCTNLLAEIANKRGISTLPYDISWNLPGYSEDYLKRLGLIPRGNFDLEPYRTKIEEFAQGTSDTFSRNLRSLPPLSSTE